jgi:hypothetical protein
VDSISAVLFFFILDCIKEKTIVDITKISLIVAATEPLHTAYINIKTDTATFNSFMYFTFLFQKATVASVEAIGGIKLVIFLYVKMSVQKYKTVSINKKGNDQ